MRRRLPLLRPVLFLGAAFIVSAVILLLFARVNRVIVAQGRLAGGTKAVYAPWLGRVARTYVKPGDRVTAGQPLVRLDPDPLQAEASQVRSQIEILTHNLSILESEKNRLISKTHPAEVEQVSRNLARTRLEFTSAEKRFNLTKQLRDKGLATELEFQQAELAFQLAELAVKEAEQAALLLASKQQAQIEQISGEIQETEGQIAEKQAVQNELDRKLALSTLVSDVDGVVLGTRLFELEGQTVEEGEELLRVSVAKAERFEGTILDSGRARVRPGLRVKIRLKGYPWLIHGTMSGRLDFVADRSDGDEGFPVNISIDPSTAPGSIYDGMSGQARIIIEEKVSLGRLLVEKIAGTQK